MLSFFFVALLIMSLARAKQLMGKFYVEILKRLKERIFRMRSDLTRMNSWILHHDNTTAHTSLVVRKFLPKNLITLINRSFYSLDLAPCN